MGRQPVPHPPWKANPSYTLQPKSMARLASVIDSAAEWVAARIQECYRCCDCKENVSPWDEVCPACGAFRPARVSTAAAVYLVIVCVVLLLLVAVGTWLF
jgi:hypothetical protein